MLDEERLDRLLSVEVLELLRLESVDVLDDDWLESVDVLLLDRSDCELRLLSVLVLLDETLDDELLDSVDVELLDTLELELLDSSVPGVCGVPANAKVAVVRSVLCEAAIQASDRTTFEILNSSIRPS